MKFDTRSSSLLRTLEEMMRVGPLLAYAERANDLRDLFTCSRSELLR